MPERLTDKRTMVGVPFYDAEGREVLDACLGDIDNALNNLGVDASIVVGINGPMVCQGNTPLSKTTNKSKYNADVRFIKTLPGQVAALNTLARHGEEEGCERVFLTDADISRLPHALDVMWSEGDRPLVGASYSSYPVEIMLDAGIELNPQEIALIDIFEADKHPLVREFTQELRPKNRIKGSLMLVDTRLARTMHGTQRVTPDSRMNFNVETDDKQVVDNTGFMHYPRVECGDHVHARLRHYKAAAAEGRLQQQHGKETRVYPEEVEATAQRILAEYPNAEKQVSDFLLRAALRLQAAEICLELASSRGRCMNNRGPKEADIDWGVPVRTFNEADDKIGDFLASVDWNGLNRANLNDRGTTQNNQSRAPIDLQPYLSPPHYRRMIFSRLGVKTDMQGRN